MMILAYDDLTGHSISMTNEDSSYPAANLLTQYQKQLAKSTTRTTTITIEASNCRDICILNTNADSGTLTVSARSTRGGSESEIISSEAMTFSNRNYYRDLGQEYLTVDCTIVLNAEDESETITDTRTYYVEEDIVINGDWTLNTGADVTIEGTVEINGTVTNNDGTLTVDSGSLIVDDLAPALEVGGIFIGSFNSYGSCDTVQVTPQNYDVKFPQTGDQYTLSGFGTMNDYQQASKYLLEYADNRFLAIPQRSGRSGVKITDFIGYGKATLQNTSNNSQIQEKWTLTVKEKA